MSIVVDYQVNGGKPPRYFHRDSKIGAEIAVERDVLVGDGHASLRSASSEEEGCRTSDPSDRKSRKNMSTARRAKHHLKHHGREEHGREFSIFPKTISFDEARAVVGGAYAGTSGIDTNNSITQWMMDPLNLPQEARPSVFKCSVGHPIHDTLACGGTLFGIKENGNLKSCLVFREYDVTKEDKGSILKSFIDLLSHTCASNLMKSSSNGVPQLFTDRNQRKRLGSYMTRADHLEMACTKWHNTYGSKQRHWYLSDIAVDPEAQRKGYGREMMAALTHLADRYDKEVYLECGTGLTAFFQKFRFNVVAEQNLSVGDNKEYGENLAISLLIRKPIISSK